ncbi:hypothetical protein U9M48_001407, partial [Paspalum notatum var. saurae]
MGRWRPQALSSALLLIRFLVLLLPVLADASTSSSKVIEVVSFSSSSSPEADNPCIPLRFTCRPFHFLFGKLRRRSTFVYMGEKKHDDPSLVTASHHAALTSILGSKDDAQKSIVYSYKHGFSGFAAKLTETQAEELKKHPGVVSVKPNTYHQLQTTRSWDFLGLSYDQPSSSGLLKKAKYGEDVIVGVIDTGIWPESRSFDDTGYGPVPKRWKGVCETGEAFNASSCNRKIIGARAFDADADADASSGTLEGDYRSARDANGHGTHTASTIAGGPVRGASRRRGGAPRARLAVYKACFGSGGCGDASLAAAIDAAIHDGVDVLSMSLDGLEDPGTLHAVASGITVVFGGGNDGPVPQTISNVVPWGITVAATTMDRSFPTAITLSDGDKLVRQSLYYHNHTAAAPRILRDDFWAYVTNVYCDDKGSLDSVNITGQIVMCLARPMSSSSPPKKVLAMARNAAIDGGAKGLILEQYSTDILEYLLYCDGYMPCVVVDKEMAKRISSDTNTVAKISPAVSVVGSQVASPRVAAFSSRGPSPVFPAILKPDIAAPGVSILAAQGDSYVLKSGTSMACPHVSAVVALLKSVHPDWSPAMIKSAIVTTASVTDRFGVPIQADTVGRKPADPFDFGGGQIEPDRAVDPGLVYDVRPEEYLKLFINSSTLDPASDDGSRLFYQLNLPSIAVPNLKKGSAVTVWRTVTNVGGPEDGGEAAAAASYYWAKVKAPPGVAVSVEPPGIAFSSGRRNATFKVTFMAKRSVQGGYTFGSLTWLDGGKHSVRIPMAVRTVIQNLRWKLFDADANAGYLKANYSSARDANGHGTHTASTIAGAPPPAPRPGRWASARLAVYKACFGSRGCGDASLAVAVDAAIHDGVDILSMSLDGLEDPGTLHAVASGITVVFGGGNDGPVPQAISNVVPSSITIPYPYPRTKIVPTTIPIPARGYKLLPIPIPAW